MQLVRLVARSFQEHPSVTLHKGCQGITTACPVPGVLDVPISCRGSMARPGDNDRILEECRVGEYVGLRIQSKTPYPVRQDW
jgi:hypothetical protein